MRFPSLSPLQSRLAASLMASLFLVALYLLLGGGAPHFAYAAELDSPPVGHVAPILDDEVDGGRPTVEDYPRLDVRAAAAPTEGYVADFVGADRSIIGRVPENAGGAKELAGDQVFTTNMAPGDTLRFYFSEQSVTAPKAELPEGQWPPGLRRREAERESESESKADGGGSRADSDVDARGIDSNEQRLDVRQIDTSSSIVYISVNVCQQPKADDSTTGPPNQLDLYVSHNPSNTQPGPGQDSSTQAVLTLEGGAGVIDVDSSSDVYIAIVSQNQTGFSDEWNFQIAASINAPYHYFQNDPNLFLVDSDSESALLVTDNLTSASVNSTIFDDWMSMTPPYTLFAVRSDNAAAMGVINSYCGLQKYADAGPGLTGNRATTFETGMTSRGFTQAPKQQFYMTGLDRGTSYMGVLAMDGNSSAKVAVGTGIVATSGGLEKRDQPGSGGQVFKAMQFATMSDGNCAVVFNLSFCDTTAYSVPANPDRFENVSSLAAFYDNSTAQSYSFFEKVLAQIPCETTDSAQYSLVKTCDDCAAAYKDWLCSVSIPRCADFSSSLPWLQPRNMEQAFPNGTVLGSGSTDPFGRTLAVRGSRNPLIDQTVAPGPYKEILPCEDVCYSVVKSCPAAIQFTCPRPGNLGFNSSYGLRPAGQQLLEGNLTCNFPGATFLQSGVGKLQPGLMGISIVVLLVVLIGLG